MRTSSTSRATSSVSRLRVRVRRETLDVARDVEDVLIGDEALPGRHAGARSAVPDDPEEIGLRALEGLKIGRGRAALGVDSMTLRTLRQVGRAGGAQLRTQGRSLGRGLGQREPVPREDGG